MTTLAFFGNFSGWELLIILSIALLVFGKRLPDVGRSLGKGIIEFKKGLKGIEDDIEDQSSRPAPRREYRDQRDYQDLPATANRAPLPESDDRRVARDVRADRPEVAQPAVTIERDNYQTPER